MIKNSNEMALLVRKNIYRIAHYAGGGHLASALSIADIVAVLYFGGVMKYDPQKPDWVDRDFFILSKGHASYALYSVLQSAGFFDEKELWNVGRPGSLIGEHPKKGDIPGVEASTGALGHGLSFGIGIAYANRVDKLPGHVYVALGDGECQEGSIWEGALSAPTLKLDNLTVIVDHNKLQAMDRLENIVNMKPFADKWRAFGWHVIEIDGHDHTAIKDALLYRAEGKPVAVIANTVKGKGVSFMENKPIWHYRMPNEEELKILMDELCISAEELQ
ncbi:transketolase [Butyrivibrio sp. WCD2001]|uniref:transketolase n=1 Tax=Butyrivibrio sp. WCD2001 TaxID=1280681 RepID=UPI000425E597|nr:transketolase [Butyrivibrio sp. WCD2001]